jgi:hydroxyacylglutathione hydrolase
VDDRRLPGGSPGRSLTEDVVKPTIFEHRVVGPLDCNCYIVGDPATKHAVVIDPGGDADDLARTITSLGLEVTAIVATHAHFDHILAAEHVKEVTGAPFHLHDSDVPLLDWMETSGRIFLGTEVGPPPVPDHPADEGDLLTAGGVRFVVRHTPGHSPGSISLVTDEAVFSGDTLFQGSVGRTDLPGGDTNTLVRSVVAKLFELDDGVPVYPGHGPVTTIGEEKRFNPFVGSGTGLWRPE